MVEFDYVFFKQLLGDVELGGEGAELGPAIGLEVIVSELLIKEGAALLVRVCNLQLRRVERGVVTVELMGLKDDVSQSGCAKL